SLSCRRNVRQTNSTACSGGEGCAAGMVWCPQEGRERSCFSECESADPLISARVENVEGRSIGRKAARVCGLVWELVDPLFHARVVDEAVEADSVSGRTGTSDCEAGAVRW